MVSASLSDTIHRLLSQNPPPAVKSLLEESTTLLSGARELEARALVEKAEALAAVHAPAIAVASTEKDGRNRKAEQIQPEQVAAGLAAELTGVLAKILREVQRCSVEEAQHFIGEIRTRISALESDIRPLLTLPEKLTGFSEEQNARTDALRAQFDALSADVSSLQRADQEHRAELAKIASGVEQYTHQVSELMAQLQGRADAQEGQIAEVRQMIQELGHCVTRLNSQLDHQTDELRSVQQQQARRAAILTQVLGNIAQLSERVAADPEADLTS